MCRAFGSVPNGVAVPANEAGYWRKFKTALEAAKQRRASKAFLTSRYCLLTRIPETKAGDCWVAACHTKHNMSVYDNTTAATNMVMSTNKDMCSTSDKYGMKAVYLAVQLRANQAHLG